MTVIRINVNFLKFRSGVKNSQFNRLFCVFSVWVYNVLPVLIFETYVTHQF